MLFIQVRLFWKPENQSSFYIPRFSILFVQELFIIIRLEKGKANIVDIFW